MTITHRQYLLSSQKYDKLNLKEIVLKHAFLYVDKELSLLQAKTADGKDVYLLGHAYCTDAISRCPEDDIRASKVNDLVKATNTWTGRWVLITEDWLIGDACGLMSAFYTNTGHGWYVSSSLAVLSDVLHREVAGRVSSVGLTWQLLPDTILDGVRSLFCTQLLSYTSTEIHVQPQVRFEDKSILTTKEKALLIAEILKTALCNIEKYSGKEILLALTAGKDSRLVLASAIDSNVKFQTYTAWHSNIMSCDKSIPKKIARDYGFHHSFIKAEKTSKQLEKEYFCFCGNNSNGADATFYANGVFSQIDKKFIVIRSGIFEAGQRYGRTISDSSDGFIAGFKEYYKCSLRNPLQERGLRNWIAYSVENPIPFVDYRDRFYIEQRVNGWVSAIEQSMDINDFTSFQIANCSELISILLSATDEERNTLALSLEPIRLMEPGLLNYPINPKSSFDNIKVIINGIKRKLFKNRT